LSTKWLLINSVIIAVALIVISFFVDDIMPFIYGAGTLGILNIIVYILFGNKKNDQ